MDNILLDPTSETEMAGLKRLARPISLDGLTVAVLDISKPRGNVFLDRIAELFGERGIEVKRYRKQTVAKPASIDIQQAIVDECDIVVEGLAD